MAGPWLDPDTKRLETRRPAVRKSMDGWFRCLCLSECMCLNSPWRNGFIFLMNNLSYFKAFNSMTLGQKKQKSHMLVNE